MENQNSVCFIAKINEVRAIEGADNIELVIAGGWNAITKKGEFKEGSLTIIATTDAVIPEKLSEKMGVANYLRKGTRVRTVKLRGVYSECLIIPVIYIKASSIVEGKDLMEELGITKYEPPVKQIQLASGRKIKWRDNQNFHIYYKFPNLKNVDGMFNETDAVQITRKIHGTNARYGIVKKSKLGFWDKVKKFLRIADEWIDYEYIYGSHNCEKGSDSQGFYSTDVWRTIAEREDIKEKLWKYVKYKGVDCIGEGIIIYGEIYGAGIQKNYTYGLEDIKFTGFDIKVNGEYLPVNPAAYAISGVLGLPHVQILYTGPWNQEVQDKFTFNNFIEGTKTPHEGIVIKHISGDRKKVAKVINPEYLIASEKHDYGDSH
ncbi:putative RNA ligase [uncultured Caudovirales phage]|uniref:Putative RNA ligase n=1 Tax=uncultured Caudovirales phage TaxID=2100421 RepID=A0A6J5KXJ0_9CAUD|nr:putative RNA ligase [uncultured Caudovirales phage]